MLYRFPEGRRSRLGFSLPQNMANASQSSLGVFCNQRLALGDHVTLLDFFFSISSFYKDKISEFDYNFLSLSAFCSLVMYIFLNF